mgnify:CR=1 FL=1
MDYRLLTIKAVAHEIGLVQGELAVLLGLQYETVYKGPPLKGYKGQTHHRKAQMLWLLVNNTESTTRLLLNYWKTFGSSNREHYDRLVQVAKKRLPRDEFDAWERGLRAVSRRVLE